MLLGYTAGANYSNALKIKRNSQPRQLTTPLVTCSFTPSGNLLSITPRYEQRHRPSIDNSFHADSDRPFLQLFDETPPDTLTFTIDSTSDDSSTTILFASSQRRIIWRFSHYHYVFSVTATSNSLADTLRITTGTTADTASPVTALTINKHGVRYRSYDTPTILKKGSMQWYGIRSHFWTLIVKPPPGDYVVQKNRSTLAVCPQYTRSADSVSFSLYAGPVTITTLSTAGPECTRLLYPMWFWMRWLSIALLQLFNVLLSIAAHPAIAIILLSVCVKIIIAPLYHIAGKWQREVNRQKSLLEPRLAEVNKRYKGEEHTKMTLAVHKELGISPLYSLKSLLSAAIQIPVFFAAYHMLSEHIALSNVPFLWIDNLALPDRLVALPFSLPLAGDRLNILPFIMTSVSLVASGIHSDGSLSASLHKKQRNSLLFMAALFFLLLYTSPAGMLLYWTMNNILSLLESVYTSLHHKKATTKHTKDSLQ